MSVIGRGIDFIALNNGSINVHTYGAVGDGVTDDTAAIEAANAAVAITGGELRFLAKTYVCQYLKLRSGVIYRGTSRAVDQSVPATVLKLKSGTNPTTGLVYKNAPKTTGWKLCDLVINGNKSGNSSGAGVYLYASDDGVAIGGDNSEQGLISNVVIRDCAGDGLYINGDGGGYNIRDLKVEHLVVRGCNGAGLNCALLTDSIMDDVVVSGCSLGGGRFNTCANNFFTKFKGFYNGGGLTQDSFSWSWRFVSCRRFSAEIEVQEEVVSGVEFYDCWSFTATALADANGFPNTLAVNGVGMEDCRQCSVRVRADSFHATDATPFLQRTGLYINTPTLPLTNSVIEIEYQNQSSLGIYWAGTSTTGRSNVSVMENGALTFYGYAPNSDTGYKVGGTKVVGAQQVKPASPTLSDVVACLSAHGLWA